jgi:hypothetical protein
MSTSYERARAWWFGQEEEEKTAPVEGPTKYRECWNEGEWATFFRQHAWDACEMGPHHDRDEYHVRTLNKIVYCAERRPLSGLDRPYGERTPLQRMTSHGCGHWGKRQQGLERDVFYMVSHIKHPSNDPDRRIRRATCILNLVTFLEDREVTPVERAKPPISLMLSSNKKVYKAGKLSIQLIIDGPAGSITW